MGCKHEVYRRVVMTCPLFAHLVSSSADVLVPTYYDITSSTLVPSSRSSSATSVLFPLHNYGLFAPRIPYFYALSYQLGTPWCYEEK